MKRDVENGNVEDGEEEYSDIMESEGDYIHSSIEKHSISRN